MNAIQANQFNDELRKVIKEVIQEEFIKIRAELISFVGDDEQAEINTTYGKPSNIREVEKSIVLD